MRVRMLVQLWCWFGGVMCARRMMRFRLCDAGAADGAVPIV
ncbi:hypothetical protein [Paenibacillus odorifer]|nr:hypothetical protein [Paenibacillus odorifer]